MWSWTLNWNEIRSDLVVGSCPMEPADLDRIRAGTGATAVLSVQSDACLRHFAIDYAAHVRHGGLTGLTMRRVPMRDFDVEDQRRRLPDAVRALAGLLSERHRVYAHCTAGLGRSPLAAAAYLAWVERMPEPDAIALVKSRRPGAVPSPEALAGGRGDLVAAHRAQIEARAWRIYRRRIARRLRGDAETDWLEAERDVLRGALTSNAA